MRKRVCAHAHADPNCYRDANANCHTNCNATPSNAYFDAMHGKMCTDTAAASDSSASPDAVAKREPPIRVREKQSGFIRTHNVTLSVFAHSLSKAGWSWGCVAAVDLKGRTNPFAKTAMYFDYAAVLTLGVPNAKPLIPITERLLHPFAT